MKKLDDIEIGKVIGVHHKFHIGGWDMIDYWLFIAGAVLIIKLIWKYLL